MYTTSPSVVNNTLDTGNAIFNISTTNGAGALADAVAALVLYAICVIPIWFILKKAGQKPWMSIIPFYNIYLVFKACWDVKWFWAELILAVAPLVLLPIAVASYSSALLVLFLMIAMWIAVFVIEIVAAVKISKSFGHGGGYAVGLIFLPILFFYLIALSDDKYVGPGGAKKAKK